MAQNATKPSTLLSERAAAERLGFRPLTLRGWRRDGLGPAHVVFRRSVRYDAADLDAWIRAHRVVPGAARPRSGGRKEAQP